MDPHVGVSPTLDIGSVDPIGLDKRFPLSEMVKFTKARLIRSHGWGEGQERAPGGLERWLSG